MVSKGMERVCRVSLSSSWPSFGFQMGCNFSFSGDEHLECHRSGQKRKVNSVEFLQQCQMRSRKCVKVENTMILPRQALHHTATKCKGKSKAMDNQVTALDRASSFKSCNPFFLTVMHRTHISSHGSLNLPMKFCRSHLDLHKKRRLISLQVLSGRIWPAKYQIHKQKTAIRFKLSWNAFVKDNNLKVGDVCIFELVHGTKLTFLVHIFRETDSSNCSTSQESGQMRAACQSQRKELKTITATK
ncbi:hypothetical protein GLYMA_18G155000v4 [Glycine max]|uniref:TF-B3 domain-containing protein n=1 Tax=Glycine max TaxID=3847 RepID=A0A0R0F0I3_SOYBN|nr:hypothetical protein GYH30_050103 [Glycine max]KRG99577.1 hypothetical protein GLYMA_18G155000v4 [Glycine max]